jgi:hypothetical protein
MPLPSDDIKWPPPEVAAVYEQIAVDDAWYTGSVEQLIGLYSAAGKQGGSSLWGRMKRWFWGSPVPGQADQAPVKLHLPVPAEVARMSSWSLFGELFTATFETSEVDQPDQAVEDAAAKPAEDPHRVRNARVAELLNDDTHARLIEGGEYASAHGGAYMKVSWDTTVQADGPFLTVATADTAVPEFRFGRLVAVTFWSKLAPQAGLSYTLLERHTAGHVEFALYESATKDTIGTRTTLTAHPDAAALADIVDKNSSIVTGSTLLTAQYLPNVRPNRSLRRDPVGRNLGRSDFDGAYDLFDAADETLTSLQRDVRLAKARLVVAKGLLQIHAPGQGASFNADQELFVEAGDTVGSLNPNATAGGASSTGMELFQPAIRNVEHQAIIDAHRSAIYQACGFSPQTFGEASEGGAATATEITSREKLTMLSRGAKILAARPVLQLLLAALMDVDEHHFGGPGRDGLLPQIEWPDAAADAPKVVADTLQTLNLSESTSIKTRVKILHPDWLESEIDAEVEQIREDISATPLGTEKDLWGAFGGSTAPTPDAEAKDEKVTPTGGEGSEQPTA